MKKLFSLRVHMNHHANQAKWPRIIEVYKQVSLQIQVTKTVKVCELYPVGLQAKQWQGKHISGGPGPR